jgi:hypothetical protein
MEAFKKGDDWMSKEQELVFMTKQELDDLLYNVSYRASRRANNEQFGGILPFFNRLFDENEKIIEELDYLKVCLQQGVDKPKENKEVEEGNKEVDKVLTSPMNSKLTSIFENLSDEQRQQMADKLKEAMQQGQLINQPSVTIPKLHKGK